MGNVILMRDIDEASAGVKQGRSLAELLLRSKTFPAMVIDMIAVDWFAIFNVSDIFAVGGIVAWAALHLTGRGATTGAR